MSDDPIKREADSIVATYNNAAPEYAPELSWFGMTGIRDGEGGQVREGFVFDVNQFVDTDGLWALRHDGRHIEYVEAEVNDNGEHRLSVVLPVLGREVTADE